MENLLHALAVGAVIVICVTAGFATILAIVDFWVELFKESWNWWLK